MIKRVRTFNEGCTSWISNRKFNIMYLKSIENYANDLLKYRGYVFLKDIYEKLGMWVTKDSCKEGWIYDVEGDNYISFNINQRGTNPNVRLQFNVMENIIEEMKEA